MLAIRMQRNGRSHLPVYRIVVQESQRHPLSGRVVSEVGSYNPETKKTVLDKEKIEFYLKNGAKPSSRVAFVLKKEGIKLPSWYKDAPKKSSRQNTPTNSAKTNQKKPPRKKPRLKPKTKTDRKLAVFFVLVLFLFHYVL